MPWFTSRASGQYFLRTDSNYSGSEVQKVTYPALNASSIYTHNGAYPGGPAWIDWIFPYNGSIVSDDDARPATIAP